MYMNGHNNLHSHTSRYFTEFITISGHEFKNFRGVVQKSIFNDDFDFQKGDYVGELARRNMR